MGLGGLEPPTALQTVDPPTAPPKNFSTIDEGREELKIEEGHQPPVPHSWIRPCVLAHVSHLVVLG